MKQLSLLRYFLIKGTVTLIKRPLIHRHKSPPACKYQKRAWATRSGAASSPPSAAGSSAVREPLLEATGPLTAFCKL